MHACLCVNVVVFTFICMRQCLALPCLPCIALHCLIADCFPSPEMLCINYCHTYRKFISQPNRIRSLHRRNEDAPHVSCLLWMLLYTVRCAVVVFAVIFLCFSDLLPPISFIIFFSVFCFFFHSYPFFLMILSSTASLSVLCMPVCVCVNSMLLFFPSYFRISLVLCVHIMSSFILLLLLFFLQNLQCSFAFHFFFYKFYFIPTAWVWEKNCPSDWGNLRFWTWKFEHFPRCSFSLSFKWRSPLFKFQNYKTHPRSNICQNSTRNMTRSTHKYI